MIFKILSLILACLPTFSHEKETKNPKVYIESDGRFYEVVDERQIEEILENAVIEEVDPETLTPDLVNGFITESTEEDDNSLL
jgi:hypothetical protein